MTPFDKSKSSSSSKGLEVREIMLSEVLDNKDARIDSQFFTMAQPKNLKLHYRRFGELLVSSEYGLSNEMNEDGKGYPIYRMNEIHSMLCDLDVAKCADINASEAKEFLLKDGDLLFNRTNSYELVGRCGVFYGTERGEKVFASYLVRLNTNKDLLLPECAAALLNTRYGVQEIRRRARQSINQTNVNPEEVKEIEIPVFEMGFQLRIRDAFRAAYQCLLEAEEKYKEAEAELLAEIGFASWQPTKDGVSVKKFSDAVNSGRIDAEYFQPKFDELLSLLSRCELYDLGGTEGLVDLYKSIDPPSELYGDEGVPFVRISDFSKFGIEPPGVRLPSDVCRNCCRIRRDTILLTKDGSVGIAYKADEDMDVVTSGAILHLTLKSKIVNPDYLTLILNSCVVQMQAERDAGGSIIQHWKPSQVEKVKIPVLSQRVQSSLADKVRESFRLRNESKRLLDLAKSAVELAIEKGEDAALSYMTHNGT
ncbi:MAG: hypothetical protein MJZ42_05520 [Bacteroidales bacterium]|nr:hypothetical protein [Bacteroidales bacterium]